MTIWLGYALGDMLLFGLAAVLAKSALKKNNTNLAAAMWNAVLLVFSVGMIRITASGQKLTGIDTHSWLFLILSGIALGAALISLFSALKQGETIRVIPVYLFYYVFTMLGRMLVFHAGYSYNQILAMLLFVVGTVLIAIQNGGRRGGYNWMWLALLAALLTSVSTLLTEYGVHGVNHYVGLSVRLLVSLVITAAVAAVAGKKSMRSMLFVEGMMICLSAVVFGARWICYSRALAYGPDTYVTHMDRLSVIAVLIFGCIFRKEKMPLRGFIGYAVIVAGVFLALLQTPLLELFV